MPALAYWLPATPSNPPLFLCKRGHLPGARSYTEAPRGPVLTQNGPAIVFGVLALGDLLFPEDLGGGPSGPVRDFAYTEITAALFAGTAAFFVLRYHWGEGRRLRDEVTAEPVLT